MCLFKWKKTFVPSVFESAGVLCAVCQNLMPLIPPPLRMFLNCAMRPAA